MPDHTDTRSIDSTRTRSARRPGPHTTTRGHSAATPRHWDRAPAETALGDFITASSLITPHDLITRGGDYLRVWRLAGIPFECADPETIALRHEAKCNLLASLAGGQFALWEHRIQRFVHDRLSPVPGPGYPAQFDAAYAAQASEQPFLANELYLSLLYRPAQAQGRGLFGRRERSLDEIRAQQHAALEVMEERSVTVKRMLRDLAPQLLGQYEHQGRQFSEVAEFLGYLVNGRWARVRATTGPLFRALPTARVSAGAGVLELKNPDQTRYAAVVDVQEYAEVVEPGSLNAPLYEGVEYIETHSFAPLARADAMDALKRQKRQLIASDDVVASQIDAMDQAMNDLGDGRFCMGQYHYSLAVFGTTPQQASRNAARAASAIGELTGITLAKVDLIPDAAWWAQSPGNFRWRPRQATISSRAYAALAANHGFARGKRDGNPWGEAVMLLRTPSGQPFYLNLHASPEDEDSEDKKLPGNTMVFGVTGTGKTTLEMAIMMQARRFTPAPRLVVFDKDRGCEIAIRAMGGTYLRLQVGRPTGCNPFQREPDPKRLKFWCDLVAACVRNDALPLLPAEEAEIARAVQTVARMPAPLRGMTTIRQNLPRLGSAGAAGAAGSANALYERLGRWCRGGALGWVFDEQADHADQLGNLASADVIGFDYTEFLDDAEIRTPLMMVLLDVMDELIDGRRIIYVMTEFWKALGDAQFADFALNKQKTIRKQNGLGFFDTQSPSDVLRSPLGPTMVSQSVTKIFLPDEAASHADYVEGFGLSQAELEIVRTLRSQGGYRFLVKQGSQSAVCEFDLSGLDEHILVLSGSQDNVELLDAIRSELAPAQRDDPAVWLPILQRQAAERRAQGKLRRAG
ncbi:MAG: VirB4 family type IV secretion/conjugal transfer ATPase [Leptothrix sp. (in: b-proteobacteria)]